MGAEFIFFMCIAVRLWYLLSHRKLMSYTLADDMLLRRHAYSLDTRRRNLVSQIYSLAYDTDLVRQHLPIVLTSCFIPPCHWSRHYDVIRCSEQHAAPHYTYLHPEQYICED